MDLTEKTVEQKYIYKGKVVTLRVDSVELPNGKVGTREVIEHRGAAAVVALTDANELVLVRQYRYPFSSALWEIPAGKLDPGETPLECAKRELLEETGATAQKVIDLGIYYPTPAYCGEIIHIFGATGLTFTAQSLDEDEFVEVKKFPLEQVVGMIKNNEIADGKTQASVLKFYLLMQDNKEQLENPGRT